MAWALVLAPHPVMAADGGPLEQNDAGSGRDAPGSFSEGLVIAQGAYEGSLTLARPQGFAYPVAGGIVDDEDWYRVFLHAGQAVTLEAERRDPPPAPVIVVEIRRPDARIAEDAVAGDAPGRVEVVTDVDGWWALRVYAPGLPHADAEIRYAFSVTERSTSGLVAAHSGSGYLALGVRLEDGGRLVGDFVVAEASSPSAFVREDLFVIRDSERLESANLGGAGLGDRVSVGAECCRVEARVTLRDLGGGTFLAPIELRGPGTFHVVLVVHAPDIYSFVRATVEHGGFLGVSYGGSDSLFALTPADFDSVASVSTDLVEASLAGTASIHVENVLVGSYTCGFQVAIAECSVTRPDGTVDRQELWVFPASPPGTWTFTRDFVVGDLAGYAVFGADVRLPWGD